MTLTYDQLRAINSIWGGGDIFQDTFADAQDYARNALPGALRDLNAGPGASWTSFTLTQRIARYDALALLLGIPTYAEPTAIPTNSPGLYGNLADVVKRLGVEAKPQGGGGAALLALAVAWLSGAV